MPLMLYQCSDCSERFPANELDEDCFCAYCAKERKEESYENQEFPVE